jgi:cyclase
VGLGAGELVGNSIDTDGVKDGYDIPLLEAVSNAVSVPIIASGGAGCLDDFVKLFKALPQIDAALAASVFHYGDVKIPELKQELRKNGIDVY